MHTKDSIVRFGGGAESGGGSLRFLVCMPRVPGGVNWGDVHLWSPKWGRTGNFMPRSRAGSFPFPAAYAFKVHLTLALLRIKQTHGKGLIHLRRILIYQEVFEPLRMPFQARFTVVGTQIIP